MRRAPILATLAASGALALASGDPTAIPPGLQVSYQDGKLGVTAKDQSVKQILTSVAQKAGFELEGADLLPDERVTILMAPGSARTEIPGLLSLAPKLNYVVVFDDEKAPRPRIVKVAIFPREGGKGLMVVGGGAGGSGASYQPPPPPTHSLPLPPPPAGAPPVYQPPDSAPVYIPPETPPVYIPPDSPPQYIPADGPPVYIPPAPAPPVDPTNPNPTYPPPNPPPGSDPTQESPQ